MNDSVKSFDFEKGELLLINKPKTWTSFDVVKKIRYEPSKKIFTDFSVLVFHFLYNGSGATAGERKWPLFDPG